MSKQSWGRSGCKRSVNSYIADKKRGNTDPEILGVLKFHSLAGVPFPKTKKQKNLVWKRANRKYRGGYRQD